MIINRLVFVSLFFGFSLHAADASKAQPRRPSEIYRAQRKGLIDIWDGKKSVLRSLRAQAFQGEVLYYDEVSNKLVAKITPDKITTYVNGEPVSVDHLALDHLLIVRGRQKLMDKQ